MDWIKKQCKNKEFWHITTMNNKESIEKNGLRQSEHGQQGKGLYAIETDYDVLEGVIDLITQEKDAVDNQMVVHFSYTGDYYIHEIECLEYASEGWVLIPNIIDSSNIVQIKRVCDI